MERAPGQKKGGMVVIISVPAGKEGLQNVHSLYPVLCRAPEATAVAAKVNRSHRLTAFCSTGSRAAVEIGKQSSNGKRECPDACVRFMCALRCAVLSHAKSHIQRCVQASNFRT